MVLPIPVEREEIHTRTLEMKGYRRTDGLYDIEGNLTDVKPHRYQMAEEWREAGEPVHDLWIRLTINEDFEIVDSEAGMAKGAYTICHLITPNFKRLIGIKIGPGWNKRVREQVGGVKGCTHIVEMLAQMATAAMQALWSEKAEKAKKRQAEKQAEMAASGSDDGQKEQTAAEKSGQTPAAIGTCYSWRRSGPVIAHYFPDHFEGDRDADGRPIPDGPDIDTRNLGPEA